MKQTISPWIRHTMRVLMGGVVLINPGCPNSGLCRKSTTIHLLGDIYGDHLQTCQLQLQRCTHRCGLFTGSTRWFVLLVTVWKLTRLRQQLVMNEVTLKLANTLCYREDKITTYLLGRSSWIKQWPTIGLDALISTQMESSRIASDQLKHLSLIWTCCIHACSSEYFRSD